MHSRRPKPCTPQLTFSSQGSSLVPSSSQWGSAHFESGGSGEGKSCVDAIQLLLEIAPPTVANAHCIGVPYTVSSSAFQTPGRSITYFPPLIGSHPNDIVGLGASLLHDKCTGSAFFASLAEVYGQLVFSAMYLERCWKSKAYEFSSSQC